MPWQLIGGGTVTHLTDRLSLGLIDVPLIGGMLYLKVSATGASDWRPLSFGVIVPVAETDESGLPEARHYPQQTPSTVALGPSPFPRFNGRLFYKVRNYNRQWLKWGQPSYAMSLLVWAWNAGNTPAVGDWLSGIIGQSGLKWRPSGKRIGPAGASPIRPYE